jgi:enterochelin esterase-like enzyme
MSHLLLSALLWLAQARTPDAGAAAAPARAPRISSPQVSADRRVTFNVAAPRATEVLLTGEFAKGSKSFTRGPDGVWSVTIGPLEPEIYHYNVTIDGVRTIDPGNPQIKTGSSPSTTASILEVRGEHPAFYDGQAVPHGTVHTHWYQSKSLDSLRSALVYTPPGYERGKGRLPVLYLLHGANADETAWEKLGHANVILDNALAAKKATPFIVVMPFGYGVTPGAQGPQGQNTALFSKDLLEDLIPFIDREYRTYHDREHRALVGLSMGGGQALSIGLNHRELFAYVGGFSSGLGRPADFPRTYASLVADPRAANKQLRLVWIGCGTEDGAFAASKALAAFLEEHQIHHTFHESPGAHSWMVWRRYLNEVAPLLFR